MKPRLIIDPILVDIFVDTWNRFNESDSYLAEITHECINRGWCYQFAMVVHELYGGKLMSNDPFHAWVEIEGFAYDTDNLDGIEPRLFWHYDKAFQSEDKKHFESIWDGLGGSGSIQYDVVNAVVEEFSGLMKRKVG